MYNDVMLDLEFLGEGDNAVIAQIAAVPFDIANVPFDIANGYYEGMENDHPKVVFNQFPDLQAQLDQGRTVNANTLAWWMNQVAQNGLPSWLDDPTGELDDAVTDLYDWGMEHFDWDTVRVWSHVGEDVYKLNHAIRETGLQPFWGRAGGEHLQTLRRLALLKATPQQVAQYEAFRAQKTHDAVDDCVAQIKYAHLCWDILMG